MRSLILALAIATLINGTVLGQSDNAITLEEVDELVSTLDDGIASLKTALYLCQYMECKEIESQVFIYSYDNVTWFYANGTIYE